MEHDKSQSNVLKVREGEQEGGWTSETLFFQAEPLHPRGPSFRGPCMVPST